MSTARWLTLAWAVATLVGLGLPGEALPRQPVLGFDKVVHVGIFAVGTVAALTGWPRRQVGALLALAAFAAFSEVWQAILPTGRQGDVWDVLANLAGIALGWYVYRVRLNQTQSW